MNWIVQNQQIENNAHWYQHACFSRNSSAPSNKFTGGSKSVVMTLSAAHCYSASLLFGVSNSNL